jgi:hypothetical protein
MFGVYYAKYAYNYLIKELIMAKRRATVQYKTGSGAKAKIVSDRIWIQGLDVVQSRGNDIMLKLYRDEQDKAVLTTNRDGDKQYQCSIPVEAGAYAYIGVNAMKALVATSRVRELDGEQWVHLTFDSLTPSVSDFARATAVKEVK